MIHCSEGEINRDRNRETERKRKTERVLKILQLRSRWWIKILSIALWTDLNILVEEWLFEEWLRNHIKYSKVVTFLGNKSSKFGYALFRISWKSLIRSVSFWNFLQTVFRRTWMFKHSYHHRSSSLTMLVFLWAPLTFLCGGGAGSFESEWCRKCFLKCCSVSGNIPWVSLDL